MSYVLFLESKSSADPGADPCSAVQKAYLCCSATKPGCCANVLIY